MALNKTTKMDKASVLRQRYGTAVDYLTQSPCRNCWLREQLPNCRAECELLEQLQKLTTPMGRR